MLESSDLIVGPQGPKGVKPLGSRPLFVAAFFPNGLDRSDIVDGGIPDNMFGRLLDGHMIGAFADYDYQLRLVYHRTTIGREVLNRPVWAQ